MVPPFKTVSVVTPALSNVAVARLLSDTMPAQTGNNSTGTKMDYYAVLQVDKKATTAEIKKA